MGLLDSLGTLTTLKKEDFKYMGKGGETKRFLKGKPIHQ